MDENQQEIQKLLEQLHDVQTSSIGWWPPAPGWWVVMLLLMVLAGFLLLKVLRHRKRFQWVSLAETELNALESDFKNSVISAQTALSRLSVLLRRSAMAAKGRHVVARATDEQWILIIADIGDGHGFSRTASEVLVQAPYRAQPLPDVQVLDLLRSCRAWLQGARKKRGDSDV